MHVDYYLTQANKSIFHKRSVKEIDVQIALGCRMTRFNDFKLKCWKTQHFPMISSSNVEKHYVFQWFQAQLLNNSMFFNDCKLKCWKTQCLFNHFKLKYWKTMLVKDLKLKCWKPQCFQWFQAQMLKHIMFFNDFKLKYWENEMCFNAFKLKCWKTEHVSIHFKLTCWNTYSFSMIPSIAADGGSHCARLCEYCTSTVRVLCERSPGCFGVRAGAGKVLSKWCIQSSET
jgi:hypothetical protein